ncbi:MAG TPA: GntR family transcriptional regulator [Polyangiaceae bacterium]|nr:GntR family transcriptional regulator [Polyangiaceae bacterium]
MPDPDWTSCLDNLGVPAHALRVLSNGALPLYAQIARRLRAQIQAGQHARGARIPSEHDLAAQFAVGRPTVRQATELLVQEGVLERRRGSGTFVSELPKEVDVFSAFGTLASLAQSELPVSVRLLGKVRKIAPPEAARARLKEGRAFFVQRLCSLAGKPLLLEEMYFEPEVFPGLDVMPLKGRSLSELSREHFQLRPVSAEQRFSLFALDEKRAQWLGLPVGREVLKVERCLDFAGAPRAHYAELFCRTDQVCFTQHLSFGATSKASTLPDRGRTQAGASR